MKFERLIWPLHLLLALLFGAYYLAHTVALDIAAPELLAHFEGHKPYQLRVLMPLLLAFLEKGGVEIARGCQIIALGSALALAALFRLYLREFVGSKAAALSLSIWPFLALFYSHRWFYLPDLPSLAFLTLGLLLLQRQKWALFGFILGAATLNRESSVLLILAFALTYFAPRDALFWRRLALLSALWLGLKLGLSLMFARSPGPNLEWHWAENLAFLSHPATWNWGFRLSLLVWAATLGLSFGLWRALPRLLRVSTLLGPFLGLVFLCVGVVSETRLLGEMIPLLLPPICVGLNGLSGAGKLKP